MNILSSRGFVKSIIIILCFMSHSYHVYGNSNSKIKGEFLMTSIVGLYSPDKWLFGKHVLTGEFTISEDSIEMLVKNASKSVYTETNLNYLLDPPEGTVVAKRLGEKLILDEVTCHLPEIPMCEMLLVEVFEALTKGMNEKLDFNFTKIEDGRVESAMEHDLTKYVLLTVQSDSTSEDDRYFFGDYASFQKFIPDGFIPPLHKISSWGEEFTENLQILSRFLQENNSLGWNIFEIKLEVEN